MNDHAAAPLAQPPTTTSPSWPLVRVAVFWVGYMAILLVGTFPQNMVPKRWGQTVWALWSASLVFALTLIFLRREGRSVADVGLAFRRGTILRFVIGALAGLAVHAANIAAVSGVAGGIAVVRAGNVYAGAIAWIVGVYVAKACMEGFGFRGYPLFTLLERWGPWPAVMIVAGAFALSHVAFGWSWDQVVLGVFPNGVLFAMVAIASRGLAMPIALHAAINTAQWSLGQGGGEGPWRIVIAPSALSRVTAVAPITSIAVYLVAILVAWLWYRSRLRSSAAG